MKALDDLKKIAENFNSIGSIAITQAKLLEIHSELDEATSEADSEYVGELLGEISTLEEKIEKDSEVIEEFKLELELKQNHLGQLVGEISSLEEKIQKLTKEKKK